MTPIPISRKLWQYHGGQCLAWGKTIQAAILNPGEHFLNRAGAEDKNADMTQRWIVGLTEIGEILNSLRHWDGRDSFSSWLSGIHDQASRCNEEAEWIALPCLCCGSEKTTKQRKQRQTADTNECGKV